MAGPAATSSADHPPCPDPSVHAKLNRLSEAASTAALLVTQGDRNTHTPTSSGRESVLGPDGKLSSRGAATSLKYAKAQDLPSFPTHGLQQGSAGAAALLAKDYKAKDIWQPEMSHAGSKAAVKAHKDGGRVDLWQPSASSDGNSAAVLAMRNTGLSPQVDRGYTNTGKSNSLLAATMSHNHGRQRAGSTPAPKPSSYPDSRNSAQNAMSAAAISHRASTRVASPPSQDGWSSEANQAARITHIGDRMKPEMFGDRPPVQPELDEQKHNAAIRASAVSMAKQMYDYTEEKRLQAEAAEAGAGAAHRRNPSLPSQPDLKQEAMRYIHLQDAAHKLAHERLSKMDRDFEAGRFREYYGYQNHQVKQSRLSVRGSRRKRASSDGGRDLDSSDDEDHARRIRQQMSELSSGVTSVDQKKQDDDRARLFAAAEKRVHARMHDMDEKVFQDTGKVSQAMMEGWEAKARERAEKAREERDKHPGQTHIGGGKFMSQAEIEAIATARLQSTFDEINDTAEKRRARDAEYARQKDARHTEKMEEKIKQDHQKAEFRRIRDTDKAAARKEKEDRKAEKRAEQEAARVRKSEDKRKSRDIEREKAAAALSGVTVAEIAEKARKDDDQQTDDIKEKRSSHGILGRFSSKLKKRDDTEKAVANPVERQSVQQSEVADETRVSSVEEGRQTPDELARHHEDTNTAAAGVAVAAGLGAIGGVVAGITATHHAKEEEEEQHQGDDSSISDDESHTSGTALALVPTGEEHTGHYTDAVPSPGIAMKPELERHISMIHTSDGESDAFDDDDDEDDEDDSLYRREPVSPLVPEEKNDPMETAAPIATGAIATTAVIAATHEPEAPVPEPSGVPSTAAQSSAVSAPVATSGRGEGAGQEKDSKKLHRFFSKLRHRHPKPNEKVPDNSVPAAPAKPVSKDDPIIPVTTTTAGEEADAADAATSPSEERKLSSTHDGSRPSVSSFRRHAQDLQDPDDASSSGADEEDVSRGRTGRFVRRLGLKRDSKANPTESTPAPAIISTTAPTATPASPTGPARTSGTSHDEEQFEEARDHFDEGLAPSPAFAGQLKSQSPARETKFQENL